MSDLTAYLEDRRRIVDDALERLMPAESTRPAVLHEAMRYSVFSGGKRLRPILCLAAAEAVEAFAECALLPAAAVELLHTYTLIHDDLPCMDDDDFRRGKPTSHKVFGEANAVLAGDALQTLAFEILAHAEAPAPYPPTQLVQELAAAAGSRGVIGGQVEDLAAAGRTPDAATVAFVHRHKTAVLFRAAVRLGAVAGAATAEDLGALSDYGESLGLAFQIADDLLDAGTALPAAGGAAPVETTCLSVYDRATAERKADALTEAALAALKRLPSSGTIRLAEIANSLRHRKI